MKTITIMVHSLHKQFHCKVVIDHPRVINNTISLLIYCYINWRLELLHSTTLLKNKLRFRQLLKCLRWSSTIRKTYP
jgi:hypothetical protein